MADKTLPEFSTISDFTTGSQLYVVDGSTSYRGYATGMGYFLTGYYGLITSGNLQTSGTALQNQIFGLSGQFNITGLNSLNRDITLSGKLSSTGTTLINLINGLSGQLDLTGANLSSQISSLSSINENTGVLQIHNIEYLMNINHNTLQDGQSAFVKGYFTTGDRGAGMFVWDPKKTDTVDSGRFFAATSSPSLGRWKRVFTEAPNICMWGARPATSNGAITTDSTKTIQNAVNSLLLFNNNSLLSTMVFSAGYYKISSPIVVRGHQLLLGEGLGAYISGHNCDVFRFSGANIALNYGYRSQAQADAFWEHSARVKNIEFYVPPDCITGAGIVIHQPGEKSSIEYCGFHGGRAGIVSMGAGAPGLTIKHCNFVDFYEAGIILQPTIIATGIDPSDPLSYSYTGYGSSAGGEYVFDSVSSDQRLSSAPAPGLLIPTQTSSLIKIISGHYSLDINNCKIEGWHGGGLVHYQVNPAFEGYNNQSLRISYRGGAINWANQCPLIVLTGASGWKDWRTSNAGQSPFVIIEPGTMYNIGPLILDYNLPDYSGKPFCFYPDLAGGTMQTEPRRPITYSASYGSHGNSPDIWSGVSRRIYQEGKLISKFKPTETGWYRFLLAPGSTNYLLGGNFRITSVGMTDTTNDTEDTDETLIDFNAFLDNRTGYININYAASSLTSKITGIRYGKLAGVNGYTFIDLGIGRNVYQTGSQVYPVTNNEEYLAYKYERHNYIKIFSDVNGFEKEWQLISPLIDPYLVTVIGYSGPTVPLYMENITIPSHALMDYKPYVIKPDTATSKGSIGQIAVKTDYLYICTGDNLWGRTALVTW